MTELDKVAMDRVLKARASLILARRFYGVLVSNVEPVLTRAVPTAATNGKKHFWNPDFVAELTQDYLEFAQAHESEHDARHHGTRRGSRDPQKWNEACDYAINPDLVAEGFKAPSWVLLDPRFAGMAAEDIYRIRELEQQQKDKPHPQKPEDEPEENEGEDEGDDTSEPNEQEGDEPESDDGDPGVSDDGVTDARDKPEGEDEGEGDSMNDDGGLSPSESADQDAELDPVGDSAHSLGESSDGNGEDEPQSSGDPGRAGEVLDAADDPSEIAELDQKWERVVRQAASMAKAIGQLPGHITREIDRANNPGQDWREVLRAWFDQGALRIETWNTPNRRFVGAGLYLPGNRRDGVNKVAFLIDTSGSMDAIALGMVRNEAQAALDDGAIDEVVVVYGDTRVNRVDNYHTGEEIEFDPRGGGGTRLRPLFDYVAEQVDDASLIVVFTDMEFEDLNSTEEPAVPVLFAATGYPDRVREYLANAPWNAPGIDVGQH
jgi:predicted metal-dependent peptidase